MLSLIGFGMILVVVLALVKQKTIPVILFTLLPIAAGLLAGFDIFELTSLAAGGVSSVISTLSLFVFSISFFSLMTDAGVFESIVSKVAPLAKNSVTAVLIITVVVALITHLDGAGATTLLITIPAMLPFYKKFNIRPQALMLIVVMAIGCLNMVPWGGPTMIAASVIGQDVNDLWHPMIPVQIFMALATFVLAVIIAKVEIKNGAGLVVNETIDTTIEKKEVNTKLLFVNFALTFITIATLVVGGIPANVVFMIATAVGLLINVRTAKEQAAKIKKYGSSAMTMTTTLLAVGVFTGILSGTGIIDAMALSVTAIIPPFLGPYIHIIIGILAVPLIMSVGTESLLVGLMPVVISVGATYGVSSEAVAQTLLIAENFGVGVSPITAAIYLGLGLMDLDMGSHIKYSLKWAWGMSILAIIFGIIIGLVPL